MIQFRFNMIGCVADRQQHREGISLYAVNPVNCSWLLRERRIAELHARIALGCKREYRRLHHFNRDNYRIRLVTKIIGLEFYFIGTWLQKDNPCHTGIGWIRIRIPEPVLLAVAKP